MNAAPIHLMIIDDDPCFEEIIIRLLQKADGRRFEFSHAEDGACGLEMFRASQPDVILLDYELPDMNGVDFLGELTDEDGFVTCPAIMMTGQGNEKIAVSALKHGAVDYGTKSDMTTDSLLRAIDNAVYTQRLQQQLREPHRLLKQKNDRLAELYRTAHEFVDNVSHEFRTPLTVIKEFTSILNDGLVGEVTPEQQSYLRTVLDRVDDLSTMVDDMLDVSKLEAGLLGVVRAPVTIDDVLGRIRSILDRKAGANEIRLKIETETDLPPLFCDREKIGRVIINLTTNAIKFSDRDTDIKVWAKRDQSSGMIRIGVTDHGPGIDPKKVSEIFDRFKQLEGDIRASTKGFGLGLNIARELVSLNLGEMSVESELGKGSTFSFTIPSADPCIVMKRYLDRILVHRNRTPELSLLRARADANDDRRLFDELDLFIQHHLRETDLAFRTVPDSWILVLACVPQEIDAFLERIHNARREANRNRPGVNLPEVSFESIGTWNIESFRDEFMTQFEQVIEQETRIIGEWEVIRA